MTSTAKRPGKDWLFSRAFVVFSSNFCYFSRVLFGGIGKNCIFAHCKGVDTISYPVQINANEL